MKSLTILALAAVASSAIAQNAFLTKPDIHGDTVVFTAEGDLWLGSIKDHSAHRITSDAGLETAAKFSPDGKMIAFTAQYEGGNDVYVMPVSGGAPKRLTWDLGARVQGWTPDGGSVIYRSARYNTFGVMHLFQVPVTGGMPKQLPVPRAEFGSLNADGKLIYVPKSFEWANWFRYQGGGADDLWITDLKGSFKKVTGYEGIDTMPVWSGKKVFFVSERSGALNLWNVDPNSGKLQQITDYTDGGVRYPGADDKRVIFQHGAGLAVYDADKGVAEDVKFDLSSDRIHSLEQRIRLAAFATNPAIGPSGKRVAIESRGQIVSVAVEQGDMRVLEAHKGARAIMPVWSPDGKKVAFVSDRSGENEIWVVSATGGDATQLTTGLKANPSQPVWSPDGANLTISDREGRLLLIDAKTGVIKEIDRSDRTGSYDGFMSYSVFSPDSKYVAFTHLETNWLTGVYVYDIAAGKSIRISHPEINSSGPSFDADGKYVIFLGDTQLEPISVMGTGKYGFDNITRVYMAPLSPDTASPFLEKNDEEGDAEKKKDEKPVVDLTAIENRLIQCPIPAGRYQQTLGLPGKILLVNQTGLAFNSGAPGELLSFNIDSKAMTTLIPTGVGGIAKSFDNKKILVSSGHTVAVIDAASGPTTLQSKAINLAPYAIKVEPESEWKGIFNESWRIARDFFYDPNMHGVNWKVIKAKYEARLPMVGDRTDLSQLLKDMVSELNSGHAYITNPAPYNRPPAMGFLGADYEAVPGAAAVKIKRIYKGDAFSDGADSPLAAPGLKVKEGDYILEIAGQTLGANQDPQALLVGTPGQTIAIRVNDKPILDGSRLIRIKPIPSEAALRYQAWVDGRADYVHTHGGANFGYLHVPNMGGEGVVGFTKGQFPNVYKDGMIYDIRYNGGGFISSLLLENIAAKPYIWWKPRYGNYWTRENWAHMGPNVALCNEYNFSDGELFVETWKRMKLGAVVGKRTGGGEVGSGGGYGLVDGGSIYVPNYAGFIDDKWVVEGHGADPTIDVENDPASEMAGVDKQLDAAIAALNQQLMKNPIVWPKHPPFPVRPQPTKKG